MDILKLDDWDDVPENYTGIVDYDYHIEYYLNGLLHREDGPAVIYPNNCVYYFLNNNDITEEVEEWIKKNNIPEVWTNSHKILFKLTFG